MFYLETVMHGHFAPVPVFGVAGIGRLRTSAEGILIEEDANLILRTTV